MLITDQKQIQNYTASKSLWQGIPSIEVTPKGRTFVTFYSGGTREEIGNYVLLIKSDDGVNYGDPIAVCFEEGARCFDPCLWRDPLGRLWFTWSKDPDGGLFAAICDDPDADEIVFGEEFFVGHNIMMNKPTVLSTGEWAFPIAVWNDGVRVPPAEFDSNISPKGSFMFVTCDEGKTFQKLGTADVKNRSFDEHMFLELENGVVRVFVRTKYGIGAADSYDSGLHWGEDFDTGYGGPSSRFHIRRLASGRVLLINHFNFTGRNNLMAMLSEDDGKTFPYKLMLDERKSVSYPDAAIDGEGRIHITYDRERGAFLHSFDAIMNSAREILTACVTEEDILRGEIVSEGSFLKRVVYKLTDYDGDIQNPFNENTRFTDSKYADFLNTTYSDAEGIIAEIFDAYQINCTNIHNVQSETLDKLIETYIATKDLSVLTQIIAMVRSASCEDKYSEKSLVDEICCYISNHLEENCSTASIASKFFLSQHYLRHVFKKQTGISISAFKAAEVLKKAKLLLRISDKKIIDIASVCGFENSSYFAEFFTKEAGISPKDYRQKYTRT